jgi:hypothetical protein
LCLNKVFCWLAWVLVKVIRFVLVTVGKWVIRVVCTVVNFVLDVVGFILGLVLAIPILGGILRTVLNWALEVFWRLIGLVDFILSLLGLRIRKKLYFGMIIPKIKGVDLATEAQMQPQVDSVIAVYKQTCNIDARFTGFCHTEISPPGGTLVVACDAAGFFGDWWTKGSWFEFVSRVCKFQSNWRNITGYGGELYCFVVNAVDPTTTEGCSQAATHNYVALEVTADQNSLAHEFGHAMLLLFHNDSDVLNLMHSTEIGHAPTDMKLTNWQASVVRSSRHVTYF